LVPPHSIHDIIYRDLFIFHTSQVPGQFFWNLKSIMLDDSFRVYTSLFELSFLLAPFLVWGFYMWNWLVYHASCAVGNSFAIIRQGHLFCLEHYYQWLFYLLNFANELYIEDQDETIIFPFKCFNWTSGSYL